VTHDPLTRTTPGRRWTLWSRANGCPWYWHLEWSGREAKARSLMRSLGEQWPWLEYLALPPGEVPLMQAPCEGER
jgi:hypothetical protein